MTKAERAAAHAAAEKDLAGQESGDLGPPITLSKPPTKKEETDRRIQADLDKKEALKEGRGGRRRRSRRTLRKKRRHRSSRRRISRK